MFKGLTRAGVGNVGSLAEFIRLAAKYRFDSVDTGGKQIREMVKQMGVDGATAYLQEHRMRIGALGLSAQWREDEAQFRDGISLFVQEVEAAHQIGCRVCTTYIPASTDQNPAAFLASATRRLRLCAQILDAYGMKMAIEFVGPHHKRLISKHPFIWSAQQTQEWIEAIGCRNVGLLYDSYHWYTNELTVEDILQLDKSQIVHVHLNDALPLPVGELLDNDRRYPGEGVIDLVGFLSALKQIGYEGAVSQEVISLQPPAESSESLIEKSGRAFEALFAAAGLD